MARVIEVLQAPTGIVGVYCLWRPDEERVVDALGDQGPILAPLPDDVPPRYDGPIVGVGGDAGVELLAEWFGSSWLHAPKRVPSGPGLQVLELVAPLIEIRESSTIFRLILPVEADLISSWRWRTPTADELDAFMNGNLTAYWRRRERWCFARSDDWWMSQPPAPAKPPVFVRGDWVRWRAGKMVFAGRVDNPDMDGWIQVKTPDGRFHHVAPNIIQPDPLIITQHEPKE